MRMAITLAALVCSPVYGQSTGSGKSGKKGGSSGGSTAAAAKVRKSLEAMGAAFMLDAPNGVHLQFAGNGTDAALEEAAKLPNLIGVDVFNSKKVTDAGVAALSKSKTLFKLALTNTSITSKGIETISAKPGITSLRLTTRKLDAAGLKSLAGMPKLKVLNLDGCSVADADLASLKDNRTIQILTLRKTDVGGEGLASLYGMSQLKEIDLVLTTTSKAQIKDLKKAIPGLEVRGEGTVLGKKRIPAKAGK